MHCRSIRLLVRLTCLCLSIQCTMTSFDHQNQPSLDLQQLGHHSNPNNGAHVAHRCEEIKVPLCRGLGYSLTSMPNQFQHATQDEAGLEAHQFYPLVAINCSADLRFFVCSMYTPICLPDYGRPLPPCRSVCQRAKAGCAPVMLQYGFDWPENLDCSKSRNLIMFYPCFIWFEIFQINCPSSATKMSCAWTRTKRLRCLVTNRQQ